MLASRVLGFMKDPNHGVQSTVQLSLEVRNSVRFASSTVLETWPIFLLSGRATLSPASNHSAWLTSVPLKSQRSPPRKCFSRLKAQFGIHILNSNSTALFATRAFFTWCVFLLPASASGLFTSVLCLGCVSNTQHSAWQRCALRNARSWSDESAHSRPPRALASVGIWGLLGALASSSYGNRALRFT